MKTAIVSIIMVLKSMVLYAHCSIWYPGTVYLEDGVEVNGDIQYCLEEDLVLLKQNNQMLTFTSVTTDHFIIYDHEQVTHRIFVTLPHEEIENYSRTRFFELLYHGKISLLNRGYKVLVTEEEMVLGQLVVNEKWVDADKYYLLDGTGTVWPYTGKKKDLMNYIGDDNRMMETMIKESGINIYSRNGLIALLNYMEAMQYTENAGIN